MSSMLDAQRKESSRFGNHLKEGLKNESPWLQAEDIPDESYIDLFVGNKHFDNFFNNSNQVIFGRRGTGKTHLLKAIKEKIDNESCNNNMAIYISCIKFCSTPPNYEFEDETDKQKKMASYIIKSITHEIADKLSEEYPKYMQKKIRYDKKSKEFKKIDDSVSDLLLKIYQELEIGSPMEYAISDVVVKSNEHINKLKLKTGLGFKVSEILQGIGFFNFLKKKSINDVLANKVNINKVYGINYGNIRDYILDIIKILEIEIFYICIDEWSEIDITNNISIQPLVANGLKIILFNTNKIAVKIASIWHRTQFKQSDNSKKSKGIEVGQDIFIGINLDSAFMNNEDQILQYLFKILYKRITNLIPEFKDIENTQDEGYDFFIKEIFDNNTNFRTMVAASHGIPRDFLNLFHQSVILINRDFYKYAITKEIIRKISSDMYRIDKRSLVGDNSILVDINQTITQYMEKTSRRFFIIKNKEIINIPEINDLVDKKLLQQFPSASTPRIIRDKYKLFYIDFGNFIDWIRSTNRNIDQFFDNSILPRYPDNFNSTYKEFILDLSKYESKIVICNKCKFKFNSKQPVYVKNKICPNCGEKV